MRNFQVIAVLLLFIISSVACEKKNVPVVITNEINNISSNSAVCGGEVIDDGGFEIINKGICYSLNSGPSIFEDVMSEGSGSEPFTTKLTYLYGGMKYYIKAFATNRNGTGYGPELTFKTLGSLPKVSGIKLTAKGPASAILTSVVNPNYLETTVFFEYGITGYDYSEPAVQSTLVGHSDVEVSSQISDLTAGATYFVRLKAINELGISYGDYASFTPGHSPTATTLSATDITSSIVTLMGRVKCDTYTVVFFNFGKIPGYDRMVYAVQNPLPGATGDIIVSGKVKDLLPNTAYHFRVVARNFGGESFGDDMIFTTLP